MYIIYVIFFRDNGKIRIFSLTLFVTDVTNHNTFATFKFHLRSSKRTLVIAVKNPDTALKGIIIAAKKIACFKATSKSYSVATRTRVSRRVYKIRAAVWKGQNSSVILKHVF